MKYMGLCLIFSHFWKEISRYNYHSEEVFCKHDLNTGEVQVFKIDAIAKFQPRMASIRWLANSMDSMARLEMSFPLDIPCTLWLCQTSYWKWP